MISEERRGTTKVGLIGLDAWTKLQRPEIYEMGMMIWNPVGFICIDR